MAHARTQRIAALTEACNAYIRAAFPVEGAVATIIDNRRIGSHKALRAHGWLVAVWRDYLARVAAVNAEVRADALPGDAHGEVRHGTHERTDKAAGVRSD
jgi:hypothetical protein